MIVEIDEGSCAAESEAAGEPTGCGEQVFYGGASELLTDTIPYLNIALAPGDYTICWLAYWEYDTDPQTPGLQPDYVGAGVLCDEFTITSGDTTQIVDYSDDRLIGVLDVFVESDDAPDGLNDILVLLFDKDHNLVDWACTGDPQASGNYFADWDDGWVAFYGPFADGVDEGNYTVTATDSASGFDGIYPCGDGDFYETQSATIDYSVFSDYYKDGFIQDAEFYFDGAPAIEDVLIHLDPSAP